MSTLKPLRKPAAKPVPRGRGPQPAGGGMRPTIIFVALLAVVAIGIAAMVIRGRANAPVDPSGVPVAQAVRPLNAPTGQTAEGLWFKGQADAPVTVVVFGDFQCPSCRVAFQQIEGGVDQTYVETGKVKFVFHDFLLPMHPNAIPAALAARAAGAQGQFWQMHDVLYARQTEWENDRDVVKRFKSYAVELGLDTAAFNRSLDGKEYAAAITAAVDAGTKQGINATPTYVVDGARVNTGGLIAAIDAALKAKGR